MLTLGGLGAAVAALAAGVVLSGAAAASGPAGHWAQGFAGQAPASAATAEPDAVPALRGRNVIQVLDRTVADQFVDTGPADFSPGDYFVFEDQLLTPDGSQMIGILHGRCMVIFDEAQCDGTAALTGRGKLTFAGTSPLSDRPFLLAITGGTREFAGASGQVRVAPINDTDANITIALAR
jgi:hypothetical protein